MDARKRLLDKAIRESAEERMRLAKEKNDSKDSKGIQGNTASDTGGFLMAQHMRITSRSALRSSGSVFDLCMLLKANS